VWADTSIASKSRRVPVASNVDSSGCPVHMFGANDTGFVPLRRSRMASPQRTTDPGPTRSAALKIYTVS